jgi:hypothetical protein
MSTGRKQNIPSFGVIAVATCVIFVACCADAAAQQTPPGPTHSPYVIPGCQVTFVLRTDTRPFVRTAALTIDVAWLEYAAMVDFLFSHQLAHICPPQPVEVNHVWLSRAVLDVLKIKDLGHRGHHPYWTLNMRAAPKTFPAPENRVREQPIEASIEMEKIGRSRNYIIRYRTSDETMAGTSKISCADDPVNRICNGVSWFAGLLVDYRISQDQFPATHETSTDPSTESGAILQFDQRLRSWIIDLEKPR